MQDFQESSDNENSLKGVTLLTETSKVVADEDADKFLEKFEPGDLEFPGVEETFEKFLTNVEGDIGSKQNVEGGNFINGYGLFDVMEPPHNLEYLAKLYEVNGIHAAAIDAKIDNIVGLGYYWDYTRKTEKIRQRAALKDDPDKTRKTDDRLADDMALLDNLVADLNGFDEFDETLEKVLRDKFVTGNGYMEISRRRDGSIGYVGHISSIHMRVRRERDGFVQYIGDLPVFFRNFGDTQTRDPFGADARPNEIIHFKRHSPTNDYYGIPEVVSVANNIAGIEFANKYNIEYFENKAVPRYIIQTKGMKVDNKTKAELLRFFETTTKGSHHRSLFIPLPSASAEIVFTPVETKKQEASFNEYIDQNTEQILARHRVPRNRLGLSAGVNAGNTRDINKMFKETVCNPEQRLIEKKLGRLFREMTDLFKFKLHEYTLTDENEQSQIQERQLRMGLIVPDEGREKLGLPARSDGDGQKPIDVRSLQQIANDRSQTVNPAKTEVSQRKEDSLKRRRRYAEDSAGQTDGVGATRSRNPKGTGARER